MKNTKRNLIFTMVIAGLAMMNSSVYASSSITISNAAPVAIAFAISPAPTNYPSGGTIAIGASKTIQLPAKPTTAPTNTTGYSSITLNCSAPGYTSVTKTLSSGATTPTGTAPAATAFKIQAVGTLLQFV